MSRAMSELPGSTGPSNTTRGRRALAAILMARARTPVARGFSRFAFALHQPDDALREIEPVARNMAHLARLRAEALDPGGPQHDRAEMTERLYRLDLQAGTGHRRIDDDTRLRIGSAD